MECKRVKTLRQCFESPVREMLDRGRVSNNVELSGKIERMDQERSRQINIGSDGLVKCCNNKTCVYERDRDNLIEDIKGK